MPTFDDNAKFVWCGKPNPFRKGTGPWERTELARKMSGKTVAAFRAKAGQTRTLATLVGKRLIEIEGYQGRATEEEITARRIALFQIVAEMHPMTVRQVFYQATVRGIVEKEESGYDKVQNDLAAMRRGGDDILSVIPTPFSLPWEWIVDNTRSRSKPYVCNSVREALEDAANTYRKALWKDADAYVEIWLEKDALAGVIRDVTWKYDVSLMVARGYSSITFLHDAAMDIEDKEVPVHIYHLGDFDPSGVNAGEKIEEDLQEFAPSADITFTRLAVTEEQIDEWDLPTRPTKITDSRAARFGSAESVELDAIEPRRLRSLVERAILKHLSKKRYEELMEQEQEEQQEIRRLVDEIEGGC
jgi:hypothetical protein